MIGGVVSVDLNGQVLSAHIGGISNALEQPATRRRKLTFSSMSPSMPHVGREVRADSIFYSGPS
jgi:hypothetical protein